jgi:nucleoside-diphosphate-sugar epimerase
MKIRLILGCGYVGARLASKWLAQGDTVFAVTRSVSRAQTLEATGIRPIVWDWYDAPDPSASMNWFAFLELVQLSRWTLLVAASHAPVPGIPELETHTRGLANLMQILVRCEQPHWIYLSTTGVFGGGSEGEWLDESSPTDPVRPGSRAALAAETYLQNHVQNRLTIIRPAGIYGPERLPNWRSVRDQRPLAMDPQSYLNLIHVDDLVGMLEMVSNRRMTHPLYCVSDREPVLRKDYYGLISAWGGWPSAEFAWPPKATTLVPAAPGNRSRGEGNKRISSARIQSELGYEYLYPTYREGLSKLLAEQDRNA